MSYRQLNLLSFGEEAAEMEPAEKTGGMKSSHDFRTDNKAKAPSPAPPEQQPIPEPKQQQEEGPETKKSADEEFDDAMREKVLAGKEAAKEKVKAEPR